MVIVPERNGSLKEYMLSPIRTRLPGTRTTLPSPASAAAAVRGVTRNARRSSIDLSTVSGAAQHRHQVAHHRIREKFVALRRGMDAVALHQSRSGFDLLRDRPHQRRDQLDFVLSRQIVVDGFKVPYVLGTVVRGQGHARQQ